MEIKFKKIICKIFITIIVLILGCSDKSNISETIKFNDNDAFTFGTVREIKININYSNDIKINSAYKLVEFDDSTYLLLDAYNAALYFIDINGKVKERIGGKGNGPGEFQSIYDFTLDDKKNIYALDSNGKMIGKFNSNGVFITNHLLSYIHRTPWQMDVKKEKFIISAEKNLKSGATQQNYQFAEYEDISFLNVYDKNFHYKNSFLHPCPELSNTKGAFLRPYETVAPFSIIDKYIVALTQEGFYRIYLFDLEKEELLRKYDVISSFFKNINLNDIKDFKIFANGKTNFSLEKMGEVVGNHSVPTHIFYSKPFLAIEIREPLKNYFVRYVKDYSPKFHIDIFKFSNGKLQGIKSNLQLNGRLIGAGKNGEFYFSQNTNLIDDYNHYVKIVKKKVKINN